MDVDHAPTRAFAIDDAYLLDGVLYGSGTAEHLRPRKHRIPKLWVENELDSAGIYCTHAGNTWFGQWLLDDCATYSLAQAEGTPVTTAQELSEHALQYEAWLGMRPFRSDSVYLRRAVIFEDTGHNESKRQRFHAMREKVRNQSDARPHPGVFILRGQAGERRVLLEEQALAERLKASRGFRVVDPMAVDLATLASTCAGARVVMGVEGSQLIHGLLSMEQDGTLFTLQPDDRFCPNYKHITDREGMGFAFVVSTRRGNDYSLDIEEVERTLDILPA